MKRSGPFVGDYLNSKGTRLKSDLPFDFDDTLQEPSDYGLRVVVERCQIQLECAGLTPGHRSLIENRMKLAQALILAHKLGEDLCQSNPDAPSASTW